MSLVADTQNHTLKLILEKLESLEERIDTVSSKRGPKSKSKVVKYTRDETKYDNIHIFPFEKTDDTVRIGLIVKNEDAASVIEVEMSKFMELASNVKESKSKKTLQFFDYAPTDEIAIFADGEWIV